MRRAEWIPVVSLVAAALLGLVIGLALAGPKKDLQKAGLMRLESAKDGVVCYALASETGVVHPGLSCLKVR